MRRVSMIVAATMIAALASAGAGALYGPGQLPETQAVTAAPPGETTFDLAAATLPKGDEPGPARLDPAVADSAARASATAPGDALDLIVSLDGPARPGLIRALDRLGIWSRTFEHVPAAAVRLPVANLTRLRGLDGVLAVYPNRKLDYFLADSAKLMNTERAWVDLGVTGKGVTVAILDSGVDFTHPDLAPAMKANVKFPGFGTMTPDLPLEGIPNTDTTSGHGTHVAGDAAGRGISSGGKFKGIAYGADLVGLGAGEGINLFTVMQGYEWILKNHEKYDVKVVNNSFGISEFYSWDPYDPVVMTTKLISDAGVAVVFANGNSGGEMTMNPYAIAPWVIPVAAGTKDGGVASFSSGGIEHDTVGFGFAKFEATGETRRPLQMGLYHPAITATGENVISTRAPTGITPLFGAPGDAQNLPPDQLARYASMSGTSMASPEAAGYAALLFEAAPKITPAQIRQIMQITAKPIPNIPFYKAGYGHADVSAGVDLARSVAGLAPDDVRRHLDRLQIARDQQVLAGMAHPAHSYSWLDVAPTGAGVVTHKIQVPEGTTRLKVLANGGGLPQVGVSSYEVSFIDADGKPVQATSTQAAGTTTIELDLAKAEQPPKFGEWTMEIFATATAVLPVSFPVVDDFTSKRMIASLVSIFGPEGAPVECSPIPLFTETGTVDWRFYDDKAEVIAPYPPNSEFSYVGPVPSGSLGSRDKERRLAGTFGVFTANFKPPSFTTAELAEPVTVAGPANVDVWIQGPSEVVTGLVTAQLVDIDPEAGTRTVIGQSGPNVRAKASVAAPEKTEMAMVLPVPYVVAAGHQLAVALDITQLPTAGHTLLYDSNAYPSGLKFTTGVIEAQDTCGEVPELVGDVTTQPSPPPAEDPAAAEPLAGPAKLVEAVTSPQVTTPVLPAVPAVPVPALPALPAAPGEDKEAPLLPSLPESPLSAPFPLLPSAPLLRFGS